MLSLGGKLDSLWVKLSFVFIVDDSDYQRAAWRK
jgi:hypothetical protein